KQRKLIPDAVAQRISGNARLRKPFGWNLDAEFSRQDAPGALVFKTADEFAQYAETRRRNAGGVAGMHAVFKYIDAQGATTQAAQRGGEPQPLVIAAARIQADHQRRISDPGCERLHVRWQVRRP